MNNFFKLRIQILGIFFLAFEGPFFIISQRHQLEFLCVASLKIYHIRENWTLTYYGKNY